jgi:hypothetical protein
MPGLLAIPVVPGQVGVFADDGGEPFWTRSGKVCQNGYPAGIVRGKAGKVLRRGEHRDGESK